MCKQIPNLKDVGGRTLLHLLTVLVCAPRKFCVNKDIKRTKRASGKRGRSWPI
jgi:hypothetical protein